jgi:cytochrome c biogenesis protein CcmG/thiol:disulfide interchange protein DsbE
MRRVLAPVPIAVLAVVVALLALLAYGLSSNEPDRGVEQALQRGEPAPAPDLKLPELDGGPTRRLADYRGRVVVLNFWASWCKPCRAESPLLERWQRRMARQGTVLGVNVLDVEGDAKGFVREFDLSYPILRDRDGNVLGDFGVVAYPETFVIDREGRITAVRRGPVDERFMRTKVAPLLRGQV